MAGLSVPVLEGLDGCCFNLLKIINRGAFMVENNI